MSGRGVLFAIEDEDLARLGEADSDESVRALVSEIETRWEHPCELEKAWDPIHRALSGGQLELHQKPAKRTDSIEVRTRSLLGRAVLGGTLLLQADDLIVTAKSHEEVLAIGRVLSHWDRATFKQAYYKIDRGDYGDLDEEDLAYAWLFFERMKAFFREASEAERPVLFAAEL